MMLPHDPLFDPQAVETRVQSLWLQLQFCREKRDLEPLKPYFTGALYAREENDLRQDVRSNRMRYSGQPAVISSALSYQGVSGGRETLVCSLLTRYNPQTLKWDSQKRTEGRQETFFREDWTLIRPAGAQTTQLNAVFTVHCPGCGAPLSLYKSAKCPMCGTLTKVPSFTWTVSDITVRAEPNP